MFQFNDKRVDTNLFLQLQDLSTVLSSDPEIAFEYNYGSFIDVVEHKITASRSFWDNTKQDIKEAGLKTDIFLRAIGTLKYTNIPAMKNYREEIQEVSISKFASQLVAILEDIRLEEIIKKERPGTKRAFATRRSYHKQYFESQLATNVNRSYSTDELFCLIYLLILSDVPDPRFPKANERQLEKLERLKPTLYSVFEAKTTADITNLATQIVFQVDPDYKDTFNEYFIFPIVHMENYTRNTLFDELTRTDPLSNDDFEEVDQEKSEYIDEKFSTWHRENKNGDGNQTFLQFELEQGTKTSLIGDGARETEEGDQAMASIQGASGESKQNDYSKMESMEKKESNQGQEQKEVPYGEENRDAVKMDKVANKPSAEDVQLYAEYTYDIEAYKRKLSKTIQKTLEHKKNSPRKDLLFGRLSRKLLPIVVDNDRRIFYKKNNESNEIDAVFSLLVDCSASMHNKMEETKKGIVLFHEVLNELKIPHSITGFWEDANAVKEGYQPNYFHRIHAFSDSFYEDNGPKIMQLEPEEDNRDGFSIRVATKELQSRREKNKFLLVFSDGEPAASNYEQNGVVDTNEAVAEARKRGIDVVGMFLADGEVQEHEDLTMRNIYGRERLMIPSVAELPEHFAPLLKKLLLKSL
ncbi:Nitric oxide reductase activation protein [Oceanobacillus limi]|uniref:Nitric oxide reductase activation protein n=1 Tax=Oceanobacillus limi TaxID=930131 RepID=A0A1I0E1L0_9BACI|nr:VWA domain-containing protein [Oceanobacillus limi]SET38780.1 Nitric oxide reductase activation protein [Oceanobacillus limi]